MLRLFSRLLPICFLLFIHNISAQEFSEVSEEMGILEGFGLPTTVNGQVIGGGLSFSDFNQDGWDDITIGTLEDSLIHFYKNNHGDSFEKLPALVNCTCRTKQILWADLDNDDDKDLFISCYLEDNKIYENIGNLTLIDRTSTSGLNIDSFSPSTAATLGDYDNDGLLDLYIGQYTNSGFNKPDRLFKNNGSFVFSDVTTISGIPLNDGPTLACSFQDINHDLKPEIYVAIDKAWENKLYKNNGDGTFDDISVSSNSNIIICAMNSGSGDIDADGDLDIYVTNAPSKGGNVMLQNNNDETFSDVSIAANVEFGRVGWGTSFFDCENDGDLDMYVCGSVNATNALYINDGTGAFTEPFYNSGGINGYDNGQSYCNVRGDFNNDGLEDILVSNQDTSQIRLWQNNNQGSNNWIKIDLEGMSSNKEGVGAWVSVFEGLESFVRYTNLGDGYLGQNSDYITIGVKNYTSLDSIVVEWPSGIIDKYENVKTNQFMFIREGTSIINPNPCPLALQYLSNEGLNSAYKANLFIKSNGTVLSTSTMQANDFVELLSGFNMVPSMELLVDNEGCSNTP